MYDQGGKHVNANSALRLTLDQRINWCIKLTPAIQTGEFNDKDVAEELTTTFLDKFACSCSRAAGSN